MKINDYIKKIKSLNACSESLKDALNFTTSQELWDKCERGDWMLWLIGGTSGEPGCEKRKKLVITACKCAGLALRYAEKGERLPLKSIETAESWANGTGATLDEVRDAAASDSAAYAYAGACAQAPA